MIDVVWIEPTGKWDMASLEQMFNNSWSDLDQTYEFREHYSIDGSISVETDGIILIMPGAESKAIITYINHQIDKYEWVLVIVTSDEASLFDIDKLQHPNMKIWEQTPRVHKYQNVDRYFGVLLPPDSAKMIKDHKSDKIYDWSFMGQNSHTRREQCIEQLTSLQDKYPNNYLLETAGFLKGIDRESYYDILAKTKITICPSGVISPDSFRLYEALEAGCVPIADDISPSYNSKGYWNMVLGDNLPFPIIENYNDLPKVIENVLEHYEVIQRTTAVWWQNYKKYINYTLYSNIEELSGVKPQ